MLSVLYVVGLQCEFNVDDCAPKPGSLEPLCKNGGQCEDGVGGYKCNCPAGFTGDHCEGDLNECKTRPCHSHGSLDCIQLVDNYQCRCRLGYTGIFTLTSENNTTAPQVIFAVFFKKGTKCVCFLRSSLWIHGGSLFVQSVPQRRRLLYEHELGARLQLFLSSCKFSLKLAVF